MGYFNHEKYPLAVGQRNTITQVLGLWRCQIERQVVCVSRDMARRCWMREPRLTADEMFIATACEKRSYRAQCFMSTGGAAGIGRKFGRYPLVTDFMGLRSID